MKNEKNPSGPRRVPVKLTTEVQKDVERLAREANVTPSHFVEMLLAREAGMDVQIKQGQEAKRSKIRARSKTRVLRLHPGTAVALDEAIEWMNNNLSRRFVIYKGTNRLRKVNELIRAMSEAVVNFHPTREMAFHFPLVFEARNETREEQDLRMMLQQMSAGELASDHTRPA